MTLNACINLATTDRVQSGFRAAISHFTSAAVLATTLALSACGGGSSTSVTTPVTPPVVVNPSSVYTLKTTSDKTILSSQGGTAVITASLTNASGGNVAETPLAIAINSAAINANVRIVGNSSVSTDANGNATFNIKFAPVSGYDLTKLKSSGIVVVVSYVTTTGATATQALTIAVQDAAMTNTLKLTQDTTQISSSGGKAVITARLIDSTTGGNVVGTNIALGLNAEAKNAGVVFEGANTAVTDANGVATFKLSFSPTGISTANLTALKTVGIYAAVATADNTAVAQTVQIAVRDGAATNALTVTASKQIVSTQGGTTTLTVGLTDANGVNVSGTDVNIALNKAATDANVRIVGAATQKTDANGNAVFVVSFSPLAGFDLTTLKASGIVVGVAVADGSASSTSKTITVQDAPITNTLMLTQDKTEISSLGGTAVITAHLTNATSGGNIVGTTVALGLNAEAKVAGVAFVGADAVVSDANGLAVFTISLTPINGIDLTALKTSGIIIAAATSDKSAVAKTISVAVKDLPPANTLLIKSDKTILSSKGGTAAITVGLTNATGGNVAGSAITLGLNAEAKAAGVRFTGAQTISTDANGNAVFSVSFLPTTGYDLTALKASGIVVAAVVGDSSATTKNVVIGLQDQAAADYTITANQSKTELLTGGDLSAVTFRVTDAKGGILVGVPVTITVKNPLSVGVSINTASSVLTDKTGAVNTSVVLANSKLDYRIDHPIEITASINDDKGNPLASQALTFNASGTSLTLKSDKSVVETGGNVVVTETVRDALGNVLANAKTDMLNDAGTVIASATTSTSGIATFPIAFANLTPNSNGQVVLKARVYGETATVFKDSDVLTLVSNATNFSFSSLPTADVAINANAATTPCLGAPANTVDALVTVTVKGATAAVVNGKTVTLNSTLGTVTPASQVVSGVTDATSVAGAKLSFCVKSSTPGTAQLTAAMGTNTISSSINFVATTPAKMSLQTTDATLNINGSTRVYALVKDVNDAPVKGVKVIFNRTTDSSGGALSSAYAITDANGSAYVIYTAGGSTTSDKGVVIDAYLESIPSITKTTYLTVVGQAAYITMGYSQNKLSAADNVYYTQDHSVTVVDNVGTPMANQVVSISLTTGTFFKGYYKRDSDIVNGSEVFFWTPVSTSCNPEDGSVDGIRNNILDAGEDRNGNGVLDARNSVAILGGTTNANGIVVFTTDAKGRFDFQLQYFKSWSTWMNINILASTQVQGSESITTLTHDLPVLIDDVIKPTSLTAGGLLPNLESPFGKVPDCTSKY